MTSRNRLATYALTAAVLASASAASAAVYRVANNAVWGQYNAATFTAEGDTFTHRGETVTAAGHILNADRTGKIQAGDTLILITNGAVSSGAGGNAVPSLEMGFIDITSIVAVLSPNGINNKAIFAGGGLGAAYDAAPGVAPVSTRFNLNSGVVGEKAGISILATGSGSSVIDVPIFLKSDLEINLHSTALQNLILKGNIDGHQGVAINANNGTVYMTGNNGYLGKTEINSGTLRLDTLVGFGLANGAVGYYPETWNPATDTFSLAIDPTTGEEYKPNAQAPAGTQWTYGSLNSREIVVGANGTFDVSGLDAYSNVGIAGHDATFHLKAGQTLSGVGLVKGQVTAKTNSTLAGSLTFNGDLILEDGVIFDYIPGAKIDVLGTTTFMGDIVLNIADSLADGPHSFDFADIFSAASGFTGLITLAGGNSDYVDGFTYDPSTGTISFNVVGGEVVPEPASLALLGLGAIGLIVRRRRS